MEVFMDIRQCVQMMDGVAKFCLLHNTRNKYIHSYMFVIELLIHWINNKKLAMIGCMLH